MGFEEESELLKALAHPVRLRILVGILEDECNVKRIQEELGLPQSTVSQHLSMMRLRGIVESRREGNRTCYRVVDQRIPKILSILGIERDRRK
jgi:ArsR family transcriptional regulator